MPHLNETSMEDPILTQRLKDETFISTSAWVMIILAGMALYWSVAYYFLQQEVFAAQAAMFPDMEDGSAGEFGAGQWCWPRRLL